MKAILLQAPEGQLDPALKPLIAEWSEPETALQVLRVLDMAVLGGAASGFAMQVLNLLLEKAIAREGTTYQAVTSLASWRAPAQNTKEQP